MGRVCGHTMHTAAASSGGTLMMSFEANSSDTSFSMEVRSPREQPDTREIRFLGRRWCQGQGDG